MACAWLIRRFLDPEAEIFDVEAEWVADVAAEMEATSFGTDSELGELEAFLDHFDLRVDSLQVMARIMRGAVSDRSDTPPQSAGLAAMSQGLALLYPDHNATLDAAMIIFDSLFAWARRAGDALP